MRLAKIFSTALLVGLIGTGCGILDAGKDSTGAQDSTAGDTAAGLDSVPGKDTAPAEDASPAVDAAPPADAQTAVDAAPPSDAPVAVDARPGSDLGEADVPAQPEGLCTGEADVAIVLGDFSAIRTAARTCSIQCMIDSSPQACATSCIQTDTSLSEGCAGCWAGVYGCMAEKCMAQCIEGEESSSCVECMETNGCAGAFTTCSGLSIG